MTDVTKLLLYAAMANGIPLITGEELATRGPDSDGGTNNGGTTNYKTGYHLNDKNMTRMLIVLVTITIVAIAFFVLKWMSGRKHRKAKRYGVLATSGSDVELRRLEDDDEDEDETVFDVNR